MTDDPTRRPVVALRTEPRKRPRHNRPWIFSNEIEMDAATKALAPGSLVALKTAEGRALGVATFNPHTLIAARLMDPEPGRAIDRRFFAARLRRSLEIRSRLFEEPFYRLIHAEADGIPGAVVDRFGDVLVAQLNTAGMTRLEAEFLAALQAVLAPKAVVLRNDSAARALEGLEPETRLAAGALESTIELTENGARFRTDPLAGQKTGWFYDQRDNRRFMARLAGGARVLDAYCFGGGFAVQAALGGARAVTGIDRSEPALALASASAALNGVGACCEFRRAEAFAELARLEEAGERFDIVIADPPAFVRSKKDLGPGLRGYRKLARLAAGAVARGGYLFLASCSHNVTPDAFEEAARRGLEDAGRHGRILLSAGAAADHPVHPHLPETAYLKALALALD